MPPASAMDGEPARPTGAQPRLHDGVPRPVNRAALPQYPPGVSVPASRPAPPVSGPVELAAQAELAATRSAETWPGQQRTTQARVGDGRLGA
ncbi:hypothetical protein MXD58_024770, partial [Frankia sp. AgKG'84/4]|nr:hypothetical protein [Frankia sp. AgKG'84/4]